MTEKKKTESNKDVKVCMVTIIDGTEEQVEQLLKILKKVDPKLKNNGFEIIISNQVVEWKPAKWLLQELQILIDIHEDQLKRLEEIKKQ